MRLKFVSALIAATVASIGLGLTPSAASADTGSVILPVRACAELVKNFDIPGAATRVTEAKLVPADAEPVPPRDTINWVGSYLHNIPGPVAR